MKIELSRDLQITYKGRGLLRQLCAPLFRAVYTNSDGSVWVTMAFATREELAAEVSLIASMIPFDRDPRVEEIRF